MMEDRSGLSVEYTLAWLARLDLWIRREGFRMRLGSTTQTDEDYRGLYISDEEVDGLLNVQLPTYTVTNLAKLPDEVEKSLEQAGTSVDLRIAKLEEQASLSGEELRINRLVDLFGISEIERQALLI